MLSKTLTVLTTTLHNVEGDDRRLKLMADALHTLAELGGIELEITSQTHHVADLSQVQSRPTRPSGGPAAKAGSLVRVLARAGGKPLPRFPVGEVLMPGYTPDAVTSANEPATRVIAVRLHDGDIVDASAWESVNHE